MRMNRRKLITNLAASTLTALLPLPLSAGEHALDLDHGGLCVLHGHPKFRGTLDVRGASQSAISAVKWITDAVGLEPNFEVLEAGFKESWVAFALIKNDKRYIVYDRERFAFENGAPNWSELTVLAHEIGHHLNAHTLDGKGSRHDRELEADRFAGFVVSRLGGSLDSALMLYREFSEEGSRTHPPRAKRMEAVEAGWRHAESLKANGTCAAQWVGEPLKVEGQSCRMTRICRDSRAAYRLACQGEHGGEWVWR